MVKLLVDRLYAGDMKEAPTAILSTPKALLERTKEILGEKS